MPDLSAVPDVPHWLNWFLAVIVIAGFVASLVPRFRRIWNEARDKIASLNERWARRRYRAITKLIDERRRAAADLHAHVAIVGVYIVKAIVDAVLAVGNVLVILGFITLAHSADPPSGLVTALTFISMSAFELSFVWGLGLTLLRLLDLQNIDASNGYDELRLARLARAFPAQREIS